MHVFQSPGLADPGVNDAALTAWNARISGLIGGRTVSPFLVLDPRDIDGSQLNSSVKWPGNPREPLDCLGEELASKLSDWGWSGRAELHNEYLEYTLVMRPDASGKLRPKRFIATTELMEWWLTMAIHDLDHFLTAVRNVTGRAYTSEELFGASPASWRSFPVQARKDIFRRRLVGSGRAQPPEHSLNVEHALFMSENINGLSDLIFVMHFGSFPYAVNEGGTRRRARLDEMFAWVGREDLYCRNAEPGAAKGAYDHAFIKGSNPPQGRAMAFADPLGTYIRTFTTSGLYIDGAAVPSEWARFSRGSDLMPMRLEFGPSDDDSRFLDDVTVGTGAAAERVSGYHLSREIEVGPLVVVGSKSRRITEVEFVDIPSVEPGGIVCGLPGNQRCLSISEFADLNEAPLGMVPEALELRSG